MKKILILLGLILVAGVVAVILFWKPSKSEVVEIVKSKPLSLFVAADSADFMIAYAVGVGDVERKKVVNGRYYRNFIQLLRTDKMQESSQDTFKTNCKTGLRLVMYKDTNFVEEFLFADRIGRKNVPGVWTPRRLGKMNKFLKDIGVPFMECDEIEQGKMDDDENFLMVEKQRPVLTMPKFGAARKAKENGERESARDSVASLAAEMSKPDSSVLGESQNALKILDGIILPSDTAVGEPLSVQFKRWKQGEVHFYELVDGKEKEIKSVALTESQMEKLGQIFARTRLETFSMGQERNFNHYAKIVLFDAAQSEKKEKLELWSVNEEARFLVKKDIGDRAGSFKGYWVPENAAVLKDFLDGLKENSIE